MAKRFSTLLDYINSKFQEVVDFFGTESAEHAKMKFEFEKSFNGVPVKRNDSVKIENISPSETSFENKGYWQIDPNALSYEISQKPEMKKAYSLVLNKIYDRFKKMGTLFQMASKYQYTDSEGNAKHFISMKQAVEHKEQIQRISRMKFNELKGEYDNTFYISGDEKLGRNGDFEEDIDDRYKEKIISKLKERKGTSGIRAEVLYEEAKNLYFDALMKENKDKDNVESAKEDSAIEYSAESVLSKIRVRGKRK